MLSNYISVLLLDYECVIIPEFGGFIANYRAAEIDSENRTMYPPKKDLLFNTNLLNNDGLLINYIAQQENITYNEAKTIVFKTIKNTCRELEKGKIVEWAGLGAFSLNKHKILQFNAYKTQNFLLDSYGLSAIQLSDIEKHLAARGLEKKFKDKESIKITITSRAVKRAIIGIPLLVGIALMPSMSDFWTSYKVDLSSFNFMQSIVKQKVELVNEIASPDLNNPSSIDSTLSQMTDQRTALYYEEPKQEAVEVKIENPINKTESSIDSSAIKKTIEVKAVIVNENAKYLIIAGCFQDEKNAKKLINKLTQRGYSAIIMIDKNLFKVVLKSFVDYDTASTETQQIKNKEADLSLWLMTKKS